MRRLSAAVLRRRGDERGFTMILFALMLVTLMVMGALVVDVGAMLNERRELQNGADAAALAIAHACAEGEPACAAPTVDATNLAGANAVDGVSAVDSVVVDKTARRVTVLTSTRTGSGGSILPFSLGKVTGRDGQTIHARAVATWGPPGSARTLPLTLSKCEFDAVAFGATTVIFHNSTSSKSKQAGSPTDCAAGPGGKDIPGGFGWLDQLGGTNCAVAITAGKEATANTGVSAPQGCDLSKLLGQTLLVPIYDNVTGTGTNATYHMAGFGAFVLTGYRFPQGGSAGTPVPCKSPNTCIGGTFTEFVTDAGTIGGGDFGASVVKLVS